MTQVKSPHRIASHKFHAIRLFQRKKCRLGKRTAPYDEAGASDEMGLGLTNRRQEPANLRYEFNRSASDDR